MLNSSRALAPKPKAQFHSTCVTPLIQSIRDFVNLPWSSLLPSAFPPACHAHVDLLFFSRNMTTVRGSVVISVFSLAPAVICMFGFIACVPAALYAPNTVHPRLWLTPAVVTKLQAYVAPSNPAWTNGLQTVRGARFQFPSLVVLSGHRALHRRLQQYSVSRRQTCSTISRSWQRWRVSHCQLHFC